jgi:curli biogenesis system outer membrane secretion channel CsgG
MAKEKTLFALLGVIVLIEWLFGCESMTTATAQVMSGTGEPSIAEAQMEAYNSPKTRIAISRFTDKTAKGWWTGEIGDGMAERLATAFFNINRYFVLEGQSLQDVNDGTRVRSCWKNKKGNRCSDRSDWGYGIISDRSSYRV